MLDDGHRRVAEVVRRTTRRIGIDEVVVRHLLAVQLLGTSETRAGEVGCVERRALMRVLAVPQHLPALPRLPQPGREPLAIGVRGHDIAHPRCNGDVVRSRVSEGLGGKALPLREREPALCQCVDHVAVVGRRNDYGHVGVVLGRGAHHGGAADVDLLDALLLRCTGGDSADEWVEVDDHELKGRDVERLELLAVLRIAQIREEAGMHARVQCLHASVEALGEAGEGRDGSDRNASLFDPRRGAAGGHDLDTLCMERCGQVDKAGLVIDGDEGALNGAATVVCAHGIVTFLPWIVQPDVHRRVTTSTSMDRSSTLMRSCSWSSSSPGRISIARWARIGPVSTPASTR